MPDVKYIMIIPFRASSAVYLVFFILFNVVVGLAIYIEVAKFNVEQQEAIMAHTRQTELRIEKIKSDRESTSGLETYRNEEFGFEFMYPSSWLVKESSEFGVFHIRISTSENELRGVPEPIVIIPSGDRSASWYMKQVGYDVSRVHEVTGVATFRDTVSVGMNLGYEFDINDLFGGLNMFIVRDENSYFVVDVSNIGKNRDAYNILMKNLRLFFM